jgi:hypothetical protein
LTGCFAPVAGNKKDADGSTHNLVVTTRTFTGPKLISTLWRRLRARVQVTADTGDTPTVTVEVATGPPGSAFTAVSGSAGAGDAPVSFRLATRARAVRFRLTSSGPAVNVILRAFEVFSRGSGRE